MKCLFKVKVNLNILQDIKSISGKSVRAYIFHRTDIFLVKWMMNTECSVPTSLACLHIYGLEYCVSYCGAVYIDSFSHSDTL